MAGRNLYALFDRLVDGNLAGLLGGYRTQGLTANEIAYRLRSEHDIDVSHETVRRWLRREDVEAFLAKQEPAA